MIMNVPCAACLEAGGICGDCAAQIPDSLRSDIERALTLDQAGPVMNDDERRLSRALIELSRICGLIP